MTTVASVERMEEQWGALLAKRGAIGKVDYPKTYRGKIVDFAFKVLKVKHLTAAQRAHLEAVQHNTRVAAFGANGTGKTLGDSIVALYFIYVEHTLVVATSAKESQLKDQFMRDVGRLWHQARTLDGELYALQLRRPAFPETGLFCTAASTTDNLRSYHAPKMLIQLQEAQGLPDFAFQSAEMMAVGADDRVTLTGNSSTPYGEFHKRCLSPSWTAIKFNAEEHDNVVTGTIVVPGAVTRESIEQRASDYGRDSAFFIASVLGSFPLSGVDSLIRGDWIERAFQQHEQGTLADKAWSYVPRAATEHANPLSDMQAAKFGYSPLISVDPARLGHDATCCAIVRGCCVESFVTWRGATLTESAEKVIALREKLWTNRLVAPSRVVVDFGGLGAGLGDILRAKGVPTIEYNGAHKPADPRRHLNSRSADHFKLRDLLERGEVALVRDDELREELLSLDYAIAPNGAAQLIAKDDIKRKIGRSPDKLDAVVMGLSRTVGWGGHRVTTNVVYT